MTSGPPPAASKWQLSARFRAVKGVGFDEPYRAKTRRARGEQAEARWDFGLVDALGAAVVAVACAGAAGAVV